MTVQRVVRPCAPPSPPLQPAHGAAWVTQLSGSWQAMPVQPAGQWHVITLPLSVQAAPCWHGLTGHGAAVVVVNEVEVVEGANVVVIVGQI